MPPRRWGLTQKLAQTKIVTVRISGPKGVLGARVQLADAEGRVVGLRVVGSNVATGCRGPDTVDLAVREPGRYNLTVRYSDGLTITKPVDLTGEDHRLLLNVERSAFTGNSSHARQSVAGNSRKLLRQKRKPRA